MVQISVNNDFGDELIVIQPMVPGYLWSLDIYSRKIYNILDGSMLQTDQDDRGLYFRVSEAFSVDFISHVKDIGVRFVTFACAPYEKGSMKCANNIYVYDFLDEHENFIGINTKSSICEMFDILQPPFKVLRSDKIEKIFEDKDEILYAWDNDEPRALLSHEYDGSSIYGLIDRFLQWNQQATSEPIESFINVPTNTEYWTSEILKSINWEYFRTSVSSKSVSNDKIISIIFDMLYHEYIYYSIKKRIMSSRDVQKIDPYDLILFGREPKKVLINFTDIVTNITEAMYENLSLLPKNTQEDVITESFDIPLSNSLETIIDEAKANHDQHQQIRKINRFNHATDINALDASDTDWSGVHQPGEST